MKPRYSLAALVFWLAVLSVGAEDLVDAPKRILPIKSPVYALMDALYFEQGFCPAVAARPWAVDQAWEMLGEIDPIALSPAGARAYGEIQGLLSWRSLARSGAFALNASLDFSPEAFWHFGLDGDSGATDESYDWMHGSEKRRSLFNIPVQAALSQGLFLELDIEAKEEFDAAGATANHLNAIIDDPSPWIDINTPFKALASAGGSWWTVRFGRDALGWGNGATGDFLLSDWDEYHDYLGFDIYGRAFAFSGAYIAMEPYSPNAATLATDGVSLGSGGVALPSETTVLSSLALVGHRLEIRPWDRIRFAISESCMLSGNGKNGTFSNLLHDLNPIMIYHDWNDPERTNSLMTAELSANPWKYIDIYGQLAMDEVATAYESTGDGGGGPFIGAFLGGFKAEVPMGPGYLSLAGEYAQTSPWLYNRDAGIRNNYNPAYYYDVRHYWSLVQDKLIYLVKPLGYEWGPDALVFWAKLGYAIPGSYSIAIDCTWTAIGETGMAATWKPALGDVSPMGIAEKKTILHVQGEASLYSWISLGGDFYYVDTTNRGHIEGAWSRDIEVAVHATLKI